MKRKYLERIWLQRISHIELKNQFYIQQELSSNMTLKNLSRMRPVWTLRISSPIWWMILLVGHKISVLFWYVKGTSGRYHKRMYMSHSSAWGRQISQTKCYENMGLGSKNFKPKHFVERKDSPFVLNVLYTFKQDNITVLKRLHVYSIYFFVVY
jgi:hypothetical protein